MDELKYIEEIKRTLPDLGSRDKNLQHLNLGIGTELFEIVDIFKRKIAYGKEYDLNHLKEEIGDTAWYVYNHFNILKDVEYEIENDEKPDLTIQFLENKITSLLICEIIENGLYEIIYFLKQLSNAFNFNYLEILNENVEKLKIRYPENFDNEKAINRNIENEKQVWQKES